MAESVEMDLVIRALSEGFEKLSGDLDKLGKSTEAPAEPAKKTAFSFTKLKRALDLAAEAASAAKQALQTAFDMGKEGATIDATSTSLVNLAHNSGYAGDLIADLEKAAGGTVDDLAYMGSTIRLLTGETGDMAKSLADAAPELLTIARAAVKLNPTLGDTASAYEAITRAIETGQTRALKNYGIVLDDVDDKHDALNQVLEQGRDLIDQVGGNVETATDKYTRFENAIDNVKDSLGTTANQMLKLDGGVTDVVQNFADWLDISNDIEDAYQKGNITLEQRNELVFKHDYLMQNATDTMTQLNTAVNENVGALNYAALATQEVTDAETDANAITVDWAENTFYAAQALELQSDNTYKAYVSSEKFADRLQLVNDKAAEMTEALQNAQPPVEQLLDTLDQDISSPLSQFIDDLQFFIASGGQDFQAAFEAIKNALAENEITAEEAAGFSGELLASIESVKVAAGEITLDEAAQSIADTLNVSLEDALALLQNVGTAMDVITNVNREVSMDTSPLESAYELLMEIEGSVDNIAGTHNVHFNITSSGAIPTVDGANVESKGTPAVGFASGADFIVPPGYPNDSYGPIYVQSGEHVQVTPPGQAQGGGGSSAPPIVQVFLDSQQIAAIVRVQQGQDYRQRTGGGYRP